MVNYPHNNLFNRGDTDRQLRIGFSGGTITNKEMHQGSFTLTESLCSESSLTFGACESSVLTFKVHNVLTQLVGEELSVYEVLNGNTAEPFNYGKYKVNSDKPTADRKYRDVAAYDAMYDILNADAASWYNALLPEETSTTTLKEFRDSFLNHLGIEWEEADLINDSMTVKKTIQPEELSGKTVINCICELNGAFGHIGRNGKFRYVVLKPISTGLYPSETFYPSETLYPREANSAELLPKSRYSACKYSDFETKFITGLQIRQEEDDIGVTVGTSENMYVVEDNFLVYGKSHDELTEIANNLLSVIDGIYYRPIDYVKTSGKPYLEVGDNISVGSSEVVIETYILERTITAVKGQKDEFSANGTEYYPKEVNGLNRQITQLKGRTNKLIRTVDETRLEMADMEKGLRSEISATAGEIRAEVEDIENDLSAQIKINADDIQAEVNRAEEAEASLKIQADGIALSVSDLESEIGTQIELLTDEISLKVESDEVQSMIDISLEDIEITARQISLEGYTTINGGFQVFNDGSVMISSSDGEYSCEMGIYGLNVYRWNSDYFSGTRNDGFFIYDYENNVYELLWYNEDRNRIYIGLSGSDTPCYIRGDYLSIENYATINGYTVITEENIGDYVSGGNDLYVDSITGNDEYSRLVMANGEFTYLYADTLDAAAINFEGWSLSDIISDFERRISALE